MYLHGVLTDNVKQALTDSVGCLLTSIPSATSLYNTYALPCFRREKRAKGKPQPVNVCEPTGNRHGSADRDAVAGICMDAYAVGLCFVAREQI